ncbi:14725_t:CDS:1 [Gigaspora margarita]|uniref:14725_t:CDS:1 n=1 Tax=Gigaspora margarita TaxID=4874 RepID=A0ABM8W754_GIGMA|nr:14725_t:CDS:1 [Gigaspora margarita]
MLNQQRKIFFINETQSQYIKYKGKMTKRFVEQEVYEEIKQENKRIKKDFDEMKEEFEKNTQILEEASVQIISGLQNELNEKKQINEELNKQIAYYSLFFGKSFEIAQELYERERLTRQIYTIVNDFTNETYYFDETDYSVVQLEEPEELNNETNEEEEFVENDKKSNINSNFSDFFI